MTLGEKLQKLRKARNWTQEELAFSLGLRWWTNRRKASDSTTP